MKSMIVLAIVLVLGVAAEASSVDQQQVCINDAAAYLAQVAIDAPVQVLIVESRKHYPSVVTLIEDDVPTEAYSEAMRKIGVQDGCAKIIEHGSQVGQMVPCYEELEEEKNGLSSVAKASSGAADVIEAFLACRSAADDVF